MQLGVILPNFGAQASPEGIRPVAEAADESASNVVRLYLPTIALSLSRTGRIRSTAD